MQFSEAWLRALVNPPLNSEQLAHALTMAGLEVEGVADFAPGFSGVVVGEVLYCEKHPQADRLKICRVGVGEANSLPIVCGAPNVAVGMKVPCARVGAKLPGMEIQAAQVRGVESHGMLCSAKELGISGTSEGLYVLPKEAPPGADLRDFLALDDKIFTLKLTPNRADCFGMVGIAREVAAITGMPATFPKPAPVLQDTTDTWRVSVDDGAACPLYCGRIIKGVDACAATPDWMATRIERAGLRPVSVIVDVTNYVLLEMGQPLHAFDLAKLAGGVRVRWAEAGETLCLLNEQQVALAADMLVIADDKAPQALAGIMGGADSAVGEGTQDVFLEAAFFAPEAIAGRARRLGLSTDASQRFERGVDYAAARAALERASALLVQICGGRPGPVVEVKGQLPERKPITLRLERLARMLGFGMDAAAAGRLLERLGARVAPAGDALLVTPPSFRFDISIEEDLVEELARLHGYDAIPAQMPRGSQAMLPVSEKNVSEVELAERLIHRDYQEVITYSFVEPAWESALNEDGAPLALQNPIASHLAVMRSTLWGGLIDTLKYNLDHQQGRVRIFELGRVFLGTQAQEQPRRLAGLVYGAAQEEQWGLPLRPADFFDLKGDVQTLAAGLEFVRANHHALHPGQSVEVRRAGQHAGWLGALHPRLLQRFDLPAAPWLFELAVDVLAPREVARHRALSRFPSVRRDLALVVPEDIPAAGVLDVLREASETFVSSVDLFDLYRGKGVETGKKSLAFRIVMQDTERTLTEAEVEGAVTRMVEAAQNRLQAQLRS